MGKRKLLFILLLWLPLLAQSQHNTCENADFSQQNFANWIGNTSVYPYNTPGTNIGTPQAPYPSPAYYFNTGIVSGRQTIITTATPDPFTCNHLMTLPPGEKQCVRLGNGGIGPWGDGVEWQRDYLTYQFAITESNSLVIYKYAAVLQDPVPFHDKEIKPRFIISAWDLQGNRIESICGTREVVIDSNHFYSVCPQKTADSLGGHPASDGNFEYCDWTTIGLDLSTYIGKTIRLKFETWDCGLGGHFGYAYLTARCAEMKINANTCIPGGDVTLTAPEGFTYKWLPSGQVTQSIVINNSKFGDTAAVELTSLNGTCKRILKTKLFQNYPTANFDMDSLVCVGTPAHFTDESASVIEHWYWDFGDGTTDMTQNPVHTYAAKGIYTVRLAVQNTDGCMDTVLTSVNVCGGMGINDPEQPLTLHVYPNPSTGLFKMEAIGSANTGNIQIEISDLLGRLVYIEKNSAKNGLLQKELDIKGQPDGIYFLTIRSEGYSRVLKLIKKS